MKQNKNGALLLENNKTPFFCFKKPYHLTKLAFDLDYWKSFKSDIPRDPNKIYIIHAPTDRKLKGTSYIIDAVNKLKDEGYPIELILLEGCSIKKVKNWLNVSDIAIDQLISGCYGKFASEAMAMAKPTICYIDEKIKAQVNYEIDPPIVNSNPSTIYQNLKQLIENPDLRRDIGLKSRAYMEAIHSVEVAGAELKRALESLY